MHIHPLAGTRRALRTQLRECLAAVIHTVRLEHTDGIARADDRTDVVWIVDVLEHHRK